MDTEIDWQRELDSSFGTGEDVEVARYVASGHRAVRRRRVTAAVLTAAVVIGGGAVWASGQGTAVRGDAPVATKRADGGERQDTAADDARERLDRRVQLLDRMRGRPWREDEAPARSFPGGLQVREGAVVHERRDDLYPGKDTQSAALDLSYDGTRWWVLLEWDEGGSTMSSEKPSDGWHASFDAFVRAGIANGGMTSGPAGAEIDFRGEPATLTDEGLVLAPGAGPVLERRPNPMGYTPAQGTSLAIRVVFRGQEKYSLIAQFPDGTSTMTNDASGDFDGWLDGVVRSQGTLDAANGVTGTSDDASVGPWLRLTPAGRIEGTRSSVVIVQDRADADLGPAFTAGATRSGAARLMVDGRSEMVVYRIIDGELDVVPAGRWFGSLNAFVDWAREQYASGQGLR